MACDHYKIRKFQIHCNKLEYYIPIKCDLKKESLLYIFRRILLKDQKMDNHWVGQSLMKPVDDELFQKIKDIQ